ncbi:antitoxin [Halomonas cupida]|uniref:Antitoxin n=1 Tax=Halomonas cupida TaxID=44933 RepID=A0A1M7EPB3_9GAMM|nr:type II toxin-antitoxin system Phd/YefM family antitoxin [Halomonas cupida]GEN23204.1 antitoxin [Halomonas cupida]SHL93581.1 prevent-host-death family protein [Halomonas cupida]
MTTTTVTSREFNHDISHAKRASQRGPVIITDRGEPSYVLLSIDTYRELTGATCNIVELLAMPGLSDAELDIERTSAPPREVDLS